MRFPATMPVMALAVAASFGLTGIAHAEEAGKKPECFCLLHKPTGSVLHLGCQKATPPNKTTPEINCVNATTGSSELVEDSKEFEPIPEGKGGCSPCIPVIPRSAGARIPRNGEGEGDGQ